MEGGVVLQAHRPPSSMRTRHVPPNPERCNTDLKPEARSKILQASQGIPKGRLLPAACAAERLVYRCGTGKV